MPLIWVWVAGATVWEGWSRHSVSQPLPPTLPGEHQDIPKLAEAREIISLACPGFAQGLLPDGHAQNISPGRHLWGILNRWWKNKKRNHKFRLQSSHGQNWKDNFHCVYVFVWHWSSAKESHLLVGIQGKIEEKNELLPKAYRPKPAIKTQHDNYKLRITVLIHDELHEQILKSKTYEATFIRHI